MTQTLERAIAIAATAHAGQVDKGGAPYILHPLKVMLRMSSLEERVVAVLHDVVEDCGISLDDLRNEGFSEEVLSAIESVTKVPGETYEDFVDRAAQNSIGRKVKLADLEENSDLSRIASPSWEDLERIEKYRRAISRLRA
ncbi:HD domain-containing protein [Pseudomonas fluorescens]|jgi:(p)ppGpp synthase/HD superfamily hydrolase|uniref:HD domain-containing protein n=1 Tax=Pseudomonas fluorescens group TaxID=136843 RepID=UPI0034D6D4C6